MTIDNENPSTEAEVTAELAKPTDISEYVAERTEQEAQDAPPADEVDALAREVRDTDPSLKEQKKASRYARLKAARDRSNAENDELRQKLERYESQAPETQSSETQSSAPSDVDNAPLERSLEAAQHLHGDAFQKAYDAFIEHAHRTRDQAT